MHPQNEDAPKIVDTARVTATLSVTMVLLAYKQNNILHIWSNGQSNILKSNTTVIWVKFL